MAGKGRGSRGTGCGQAKCLWGAYMEQGTEVGFQKLFFAAKLQAGAQPVPPEQPALPLPIPAAGWSVLCCCIDPKKPREGQHSTLGIAAKPQEAAESTA